MVSALAEIIFLCGNNVSVKTMSLKSIGLFCSKNTLRILPYLPRDCVSVCANLLFALRLYWMEQEE